MAYQADIQLNIKGLDKLEAIEKAVQNINNPRSRRQQVSDDRKKVQTATERLRLSARILELESAIAAARVTSRGNRDAQERVRLAQEQLKLAKFAKNINNQEGRDITQDRIRAAQAELDLVRQLERTGSSTVQDTAQAKTNARLSQQRANEEIRAEKEKVKTAEALTKQRAKEDIAAEKAAQKQLELEDQLARKQACLLYTSPSPRDRTRSRMPSSA